MDLQVVEEHEDENYDVGAVAMQGWRTEMVGTRTSCSHKALRVSLFVIRGEKCIAGVAAAQEDAHVAKSGLRDDPDAGVFAVFDGHCGSEVSRFAARYLVSAGTQQLHHLHIRAVVLWLCKWIMRACRPRVDQGSTSNSYVPFHLQPGQLERTQGWAEGDVKRGLRDTFLRLDQVFPQAPRHAALVAFSPRRLCSHALNSTRPRTSIDWRRKRCWTGAAVAAGAAARGDAALLEGNRHQRRPGCRARAALPSR